MNFQKLLASANESAEQIKNIKESISNVGVFLNIGTKNTVFNTNYKVELSNVVAGWIEKNPMQLSVFVAGILSGVAEGHYKCIDSVLDKADHNPDYATARLLEQVGGRETIEAAKKAIAKVLEDVMGFDIEERVNRVTATLSRKYKEKPFEVCDLTMNFRTTVCHVTRTTSFEFKHAVDIQDPESV